MGILERASASAIRQAHDLIARGRTYAARGDPYMQRLIKAVEATGWAEASVMLARAVTREEAKAQTALFTSETETYKKLGYTTAQAEKLAAWSIEHKMCPTPEKAREIIGERFAIPTRAEEFRRMIERVPFVGAREELRREELRREEIRPEIERPPTIIREQTPLEKFKGYFERRGLRDPLTGVTELSEKTLAAVTIPELLIKEEKVKFITEPTRVGETAITRAVDFRDIDTGRLPPKQNLDLKVQKILLDYNTGKLSEISAESLLTNAEKKFILDESKRTAIIRAAEGIAFGVVAVVAPPIGVTIMGASLISSVSRRKELLAFAKTNPKAAAIQYGAMITGAIVGGKFAALRPPKGLGTPTITLVGKGRQKFINEAVETLEPQFKVLQARGKITGTRVYEINIPAPKKGVTLKILEFKKDGLTRFIGQEFRRGKPEGILGGISIEIGTKGLSKMVTRVIRSRNRGRYTNLEISTFLEKANVKTSVVKNLRRFTLTESEARLAQQFNLKGLRVPQVRQILRKPLFGIKEAIRRKNRPFTEAEWKAAKTLTKAEVKSGEIVSKIKLTRIQEQLGEVIRRREILDVRVIEKAVAKVKPPEPLKMIKPIKIKAIITKERIIKPVGKIPTPRKFRVIGEPPIKITKLPPPKKPPTPLEVTFAKPELKIPEVPKAFPALITKARKIPASTLISIAKEIQKTKVKTAQAIKVRIATLSALVVGLKGRTIQLTKEKQVSLVSPKVIQREGFAVALAPLQTVRVTPRLTETQMIKLGLIQRQIQRERLKLAQLTRPILVPRIAITPRRPPVPPPPPVVPRLIQTKLVKILTKLKKEKKGLDVLVGMKIGRQRVLKKNLPPFKALKFARQYIDKNIEASFRLVKSGKTTRVKDIKPFNVGKKFRPSKRDPLYVVEKKRFRLDHPSEKIQIQQAKRSIVKKLGVKVPKKSKGR